MKPAHNSNLQRHAESKKMYSEPSVALKLSRAQPGDAHLLGVLEGGNSSRHGRARCSELGVDQLEVPQDIYPL